MPDTESSSQSRISAWIPIGIFVLAAIAAWPSIHGDFLAGDDYHLIRNHVLVNHPSLSHAIELITMGPQRDLYQPIPMISFSLDFALLNMLGLQPTSQGPDAGAWVFHLTNILIHAANAVLVFWVIRRLSNRLPVAAIAAAIFAVHPLAAEPVAWLNGRMFMLSTLFSLATLISFDRYAARPRILVAAAVIVGTCLAHMSKVNVSLPILLVVFPLARKQKPQAYWWFLWIGVAVITAAFAAYNLQTSQEMFKRAEDEMSHSPVLYVILAMGQYFRHFVAPVGLSPWYPPPLHVSWTDASVWIAAAATSAVVAAALLSIRYTRVGWLGLLWFLAALAPTLPIVPARRALAADRYVYIPNIGLAWIVAAAIVFLIHRLIRPDAKRRQSNVGAWSAAAACGIAVVALAVTFRHAQGFYRNDIAQAQRIIACNPDYPGVYESAAWAYYRHGQFEEAIEVARRDLENYPKKMACEVFQVIGMSQHRLGRNDDAIQSLHAAIDANPEYGKCYSRLGRIQADLGQFDQAITNYERAVNVMPYYNPAIIDLAALYRTVGRIDDAVQAYKTALSGNEYDVAANLGLADIAIEQGRFEDAVDRLERLLSWMPENTPARTNLAVAYESLGQTTQAVNTYLDAIRRDPSAHVACLNLANLYLRHNQVQAARRLLNRLDPGAVSPAMLSVTKTLLALHEHTPLTAVNQVNALLQIQNPTPPDAPNRLLANLESYADAQPDDPWPYYLSAIILRTKGRSDLAELAMQRFDIMCKAPSCQNDKLHILGENEDNSQ